MMLFVHPQTLAPAGVHSTVPMVTVAVKEVRVEVVVVVTQYKSPPASLPSLVSSITESSSSLALSSLLRLVEGAISCSSPSPSTTIALLLLLQAVGFAVVE